MDQLKAIEVYHSGLQKKIKVYVSIPVAEKCETDKDFAEELYQQLEEQNIEDGSVLEIDIEPVQTEDPPPEIKRERDESPSDTETKRQKMSEPIEKEVWTYNQTAKLLKAYQLCKKKKRYVSEKEFWSAVAREMLKFGINKHYSKCSERFQNLVKGYKDITNKKKPTLVNTRFDFFLEMKEIVANLSSDDKHWLKDIGDDTEDSDAKSVKDEEDNALSMWTGNDTVKFISLCKKNKTSLQKGSNQQLWNVISTELGKMGVNKNFEQCKNKWEDMKKLYEKSLTSNQIYEFSHEMRTILNNQNGTHLTEDEDDEDSNDDEDDEDIFEEIEKMKKEYMKRQMTYDVNKETVPVDHTYSWKYNEITSLIDAYRQHKDKFEKATEAPKSVWEQISAELKKNNITRTADSCEKKWKSLYSIYTTQKELNLKSERFIYFNPIDSIFRSKNDHSTKDYDDTHENRCKCSQKRQIDKHQRHLERMEMLGRKLDLEERKIKAFEEYINCLKHKVLNGKK